MASAGSTRLSGGRSRACRRFVSRSSSTFARTSHRAWRSATVAGRTAFGPAMRPGQNVDSADFDALEQQARDRLSPAAYAFAAAGADDELTLAENIAAWRRLRLRPRILNDITAIDTSVEILGRRLATPIMVAPFGRHKLFHPEGECATARGAPRHRVRAADHRDNQHGRRGEGAGRCAALVPALPAGGSFADRRLDRPRSRCRLRRRRAHRRPAGLWLEPARGARAAGAVARHPQRQPAGRAHCAECLQAGLDRHGHVAGDLARPRLARRPLQARRGGEGRAARRRRGALRRSRRQGGDRLEPRRPPSRCRGRDRRCVAGDCACPCRQGRGLCRRRHPSRHRHRQGAVARRPRRAGGAAGGLGAGVARCGRRARRARSSARRVAAQHGAVRRGAARSEITGDLVAGR